MTAQLLTHELSSLIQESKRRNQDLRNVSNFVIMGKVCNAEFHKAAEKSLIEIKALLNRSEAQLASGMSIQRIYQAKTDLERDLKCRPSFVDPFLIACTTRSPKFATSGIVCLQRLIVTKGYPFESLNELLEAFRECSSLGLFMLGSRRLLTKMFQPLISS